LRHVWRSLYTTAVLLGVLPFAASSFSRIALPAFREKPFNDFEQYLEQEIEDHDKVIDDDGQEVEGEGRGCKDIISPQSATKRAQEAALIASLPQAAILSSLGIAIQVKGTGGLVILLIGVVVAVPLQRKLKPFRRHGKKIKMTSVGAYLHFLNLAGIVVVLWRHWPK